MSEAYTLFWGSLIDVEPRKGGYCWSVIASTGLRVQSRELVESFNEAFDRALIQAADRRCSGLSVPAVVGEIEKGRLKILFGNDCYCEKCSDVSFLELEASVSPTLIEQSSRQDCSWQFNSTRFNLKANLHQVREKTIFILEINPIESPSFRLGR